MAGQWVWRRLPLQGPLAPRWGLTSDLTSLPAPRVRPWAGKQGVGGLLQAMLSMWAGQSRGTHFLLLLLLASSLRRANSLDS